MSQTIRPFLMFQDGQAEAAMTFYVSLFADSAILDIERYGAAGPGPDGSVIRARFRIGGQEIFCSDSFVKHAFDFTPSTSLFVDCRSEDEIARLAAALGDGGAELMPLGGYGFSQRFAWINDRFGVSWQLNLA
uniref:3-demethylubiquinone-9 3-methyltransferase n=1 Tax=Caulobacter sp. (strain K31) TaxID=366602 RepID=B0SXC6_CAUSK